MELPLRPLADRGDVEAFVGEWERWVEYDPPYKTAACNAPRPPPRNEIPSPVGNSCRRLRQKNPRAGPLSSGSAARLTVFRAIFRYQ
jgi:hypothetical protein